MGLIINPRQIIKDGITSLRDVWSSSKVSTELSSKQATLVSGTNIKTINNTSLLGSGDITISGGGGDIPKINMTATTATLDPNKFYVWGEVASLDISLAAETAGIENIYKFQFQSGTTVTTLTLPSSVSIDGEYPNAIKTTYIVSIESNIAKIERKRRESLLPIAYQQVEYIKSTGTQYINLGIEGNSLYTMEVDMLPEVNKTWAFGARKKWKVQGLAFSNNADSSLPNEFLVMYNTSQDIVGSALANDGLRHLFIISQNSFYIDATLIKTYPSAVFNTSANLSLFGIYEYDTNMCLLYSFCSVYKCTLYNGSTILVDLYPCYRKSDNAAGMYDIVRDIFLTNAGTGSFIVGPDV